MKRNVVFFIVSLLLLVNTFGANVFATTNAITANVTPVQVIGTTMDVNFSQAEEGVLNVYYNTGIDKKIKLLVKNGDNKYFYNLKSVDEYIRFPLQFGDGTYSIVIYENTSGNSYKRVLTTSQYVDVADELAVFLTSTQEVSWDETDEAILLANQLVEEALIEKNAKLFKNANLKADTSKMTQKQLEAYIKLRNSYFDNEKIIPLTETETFDVLYTYVIENIKYDYDKINGLSYDYIPNIDEILEDGIGICYDYSVLLASMLRSQNIPTKLVKGYADFTDVYHAWNEVYIASEDTWMVIDTTFDAYYLHANQKFETAKSADDYAASKVF